jgi:hypothetical protein
MYGESDERIKGQVEFFVSIGPTPSISVTIGMKCVPCILRLNVHTIKQPVNKVKCWKYHLCIRKTWSWGAIMNAQPHAPPMVSYELMYQEVFLMCLANQR